MLISLGVTGETLLLEEEKGFCIVVDGLVQVFVKAARDRSGMTDMGPTGYGGAFHDEEEETMEDGHGYQLLTEVKNGAPMSSLFTILSLFTEDVKLRHEDEDDGNMSTSSSMVNLQTAADLSQYDVGGDLPTARSMYPQGRMLSGHVHMSPVPPLSLNGGGDSRNASRPVTPGEHHQQQHNAPPPQRQQRPRMKKSKSVHPDIVARATVDTTIAVIPASAFRRLTRIYPKATAHIVQVILTRFQRVTFLTGYNYLGLTSEVLRTEKFMNRYTMYELPNHLRGGALDRLKEKFKSEQERAELEDSMKGIVLHNPGAAATRRRRSSSSLRKEAAIHARLAAARGIPSAALDTASSAFRSKSGDLLSPTIGPRPKLQGVLPRSISNWTVSQSNGPDADTPGVGERPFNPFSKRAAKFMPDGTENEDMVFREAVLECMFKAIGLTGSTINMITNTESGDQSPRILSYDARRQKAVFTNAFGHLDAYDGSHDGDTDSIASTSASGASTSGFVSGGISGVYNELKNDVEIVFFPKGAVLVEQGERNPGLYYVIDGFLDVSIPVDEKSAENANVFGSGGTTGGPMNLGSLGADLGLPPLKRQNSFVGNAKQGGRGKKKGRKSLFMIKPGGIAGYIGSISSYRSFIDVRAKTDVYVGFLPRAALERIVERHPVVLLTMAKRLTSLLPRLILHIDFALEWLQVNAGQVIYHQGDERFAFFPLFFFCCDMC